MNESIATRQPIGAHLLGSIPLTVFRTASSILGERLHRIPDGETGVRTNWVGWQVTIFENNPAFEKMPQPDAYSALPRFKLRSHVASDQKLFDNIGYADAAIASYTLFAQLKQGGSIPAHYRFQVSLPTPIAPVVAFVSPDDRAEVEPAYEAAMLHELDRISASIPHNELAIQWDVAVEFGMLEGVMPSFLSDTKTEILERLIRLGNQVPFDIELGYHLCYGDAGHQHFKQPEDASKLVEVANEVSAGVTRTINWIHMPVPRDRTDDAYFAPLKNLNLHPETELYLGLVHYTDGVEGTQQRIATAGKYVSEFGVATECGLGRRSPETIPDLLRIHAWAAGYPYLSSRGKAAPTTLPEIENTCYNCCVWMRSTPNMLRISSATILSGAPNTARRFLWARAPRSSNKRFVASVRLTPGPLAR